MSDCWQQIWSTSWSQIFLKVVTDNSGKVFAWCTGKAATELFQISPDEFYELPEEEQIVYPSSLEHEHERFTFAILNCKRHDDDSRNQEDDAVSSDMTRGNEVRNKYLDASDDYWKLALKTYGYLENLKFLGKERNADNLVFALP